MKLIDGRGAVLGRLGVFAAKEALRGEEITILNCDQIIITGNKKSIEEDFKIKRGRTGSTMQGPRHHATSEKIVKRAIRGMLPNYREGRGKMALQRIKCFVGVPKEYEGKKLISLPKSKKIKFAEVREFTKQNGRNWKKI